MPDKESPTRGSTCLAALKTALMVEQHVLELDIHIASQRTAALLGQALCETFPASDLLGQNNRIQPSIALAPDGLIAQSPVRLFEADRVG